MGCTPIGLWFMASTFLGVVIAIIGGVLKSEFIAAIGGLFAAVGVLPGGLMLIAYQYTPSKAVDPELESTSLTKEQQQQLTSERKEAIEKATTSIKQTDESAPIYPYLLAWRIQYRMDQIRSQSVTEDKPEKEECDATLADIAALAELQCDDFPEHVLDNWKAIVNDASKT